MKRRDFIGVLGGSTILGLTGQTWSLPEVLSNDCFDDFYFKCPFDGGIIHEHHGRPVLGTQKSDNGESLLKIEVSGIAPVDALVTVLAPDGKTIPTVRKGNEFYCELLLKNRISEIQAVCTVNNVKRTIVTRPVWAQNSFKRYKFQIDDNSFFLRDIQKHEYKDIFECFYLKGLKALHRQYGTRFVLNCFYTTPERDFNMTMMSDRYKSQWEDNADWLRLAFHAENEFPDEPYKNATPEKLAADFDLTAREIKRFAGRAYSPPGIIHWGTIRPEAYKTLWERGSRCLSGYFNRVGNKSWIVAFQLPDKVCEYMENHEGWMHFESGLTFSRLEIVCNSTPLEQIVPTLQRSIDNPATAEVLDFLTHEQYFWSSYKNYIPEHFARLDAAIRFAVERDYKPVWHNNGFFSIPE